MKKLASLVQSIAPAALRDGMGIGGAALVVAGVDLIARPAAFIVAGLMMLGLALQLARRAA